MLSYFKNKKMMNQQKKAALEIMKKFVEGKVSVEDFWMVFKSDITIKEILIKDKTRPSYSYELYYAPERITDIYDANKLQDRAEIYKLIQQYFIRNRIPCSFYNNDYDYWNFLQEIQPDWLDIRDEEFLLNIVNSIPCYISQDKKKMWCEEKIKELFKYEKELPQWLQNPEWPIVNGKPLVFKEMIEKYQHNLVINDFIFYDEITKEIIIITQRDYR